MRARLRRSESIEKAAVSDSCTNIKMHVALLNAEVTLTQLSAHMCTCWHYTTGLEKVKGNG